jgi:polyhydroxyalkanoate synthase
MAVEDWLNDGVPLAGPAAREALDRWYLGNETARGTWDVGGQIITPQALETPSLVIIPERDRIVPPESALALAQALPQAHVRTVPLGHVGMVIGRQAVTRDLFTKKHRRPGERPGKSPSCQFGATTECYGGKN